MRTSQRVDRLAIAVFERAQRTRQEVTLELAKRVVTELDPDASPERAYRLAHSWQRGVGNTRQRARR